MAGGALAIGTPVLALLVLQSPGTLRERLWTIACLWALTLPLLELNRRGRSGLAGWGLVLGLIVLVSWRAWALGGLDAPVAPFYVILVMMAGVLLGPRGGVVAALVCMACGIVLVLAQESRSLPPPSFDIPPRALLLYLAIFMALTLLLQGQVVRTLREGLRRAEGELAERQRAQHALHERVKELRLLHEVARLQLESQASERDLLQEVVRIMPEAWQYPHSCQARIVYGDIEVATPGWREAPSRQQSAGFSTSEGVGRIDVAYTDLPPGAAEDPFLPEERVLLESMAEMLGRHLDLRKHRQELEELVAVRTAELREMERLRDDLVHMVVHDMRSPLTVLIMRLQQLRSRTSGQEHVLDGVIRSAEGLSRMANTLLDVSRLESGKMPLERAACDVSQIAAQVHSALAPMAAGRAIDLDCPAPVTVACDGGLVRRVLENLVSNGVKHTPDGGRLRIGVHALPGRARITVQDEGEGVPAEARQRIFEKFGTVALRKDQSYHSAGLGLAFCKLAVQAHGGTIGVDAVSPHGSVFWVELPA